MRASRDFTHHMSLVMPVTGQSDSFRVDAVPALQTCFLLNKVRPLRIVLCGPWVTQITNERDIDYTPPPAESLVRAANGARPNDYRFEWVISPV
jgi:hypothetical protein